MQQYLSMSAFSPPRQKKGREKISQVFTFSSDQTQKMV